MRRAWKKILIGLLALLLVLFCLGAAVVNGKITFPLSSQAKESLTLAENTASGTGSWPDVLPQRSTLTTSTGSRLATTWRENRVVVSFSQLSSTLRQALVAVEDSRYYSHGAVDTKGITRALWSNITSGGVSQGGSTITQEYAKNLMLQVGMNHDDQAAQTAALARDASRKFDELELAQQLEKTLTKDQILAGYLNTVYFGHQAYGAEAAAEAYFGTSAAKLTLPQAALLAGVVQNPSADDPYLHPVAAKTRRDEVLQRMADTGAITAAQLKTAQATKVVLKSTTPTKGCAAGPQPYFCDYVTSELASDTRLGSTASARQGRLSAGGLTVKTTLVPSYQSQVHQAVVDHVPTHDPSGIRAATAVVQPGTGKVLAMAQDTTYGTGTGQTTINYATDKSAGGSSGFQTGSTFKPFTLAAAFEQGWGPDSTIYAPPSGTTWYASDFAVCPPSGMSAWSPDNQEGDPTGTMTLTRATDLSVNTAFVALEAKIGICNARKVAEAMGVHTATGGKLQDVASLTLGPFNISPLTMSAAYAAFANHGVYVAPTGIESVAINGKTVAAPAVKKTQAIPATIADEVTQVLRTVVTDGTGTAANPGYTVAGKTGTTDGHSATWFAGYSDTRAAAVWVGNPLATTSMTNITINGTYYDVVNGGSIAAPIWRQLMQAG